MTKKWPGCLRNPIVWHRDKSRWRDRNVPVELSFFEWTEGSVAMRRLRTPGWIAFNRARQQMKAIYDSKVLSVQPKGDNSSSERP